jgi:hypothetical protein
MTARALLTQLGEAIGEQNSKVWREREMNQTSYLDQFKEPSPVSNGFVGWVHKGLVARAKSQE